MGEVRRAIASGTLAAELPRLRAAAGGPGTPRLGAGDEPGAVPERGAMQPRYAEAGRLRGAQQKRAVASEDKE